jgi:hypothetical protein
MSLKYDLHTTYQIKTNKRGRVAKLGVQCFSYNFISPKKHVNILH